MQDALDLDGTARRSQGAWVLDEESVADSINLPTAMPAKRSAQERALLVEQLEGQRLVLLCKRAVARHVREHDGGEPSMLLKLFGHQRSGLRKAIIEYSRRIDRNTGNPRSLVVSPGTHVIHQTDQMKTTEKAQTIRTLRGTCPNGQ